MKVSKNTVRTGLMVLLAIGLILPSVWPLLRSDFFQMHDYTHVARLAEMDRAIRDGHWPPRWSKNLGWGYGMPLFHFYAPLPYLIGELFHLLGLNYLNAIKLVFGLSFGLTFAGMWLLAKKFWGKKGAWLSALMLVYAPYRAVDFYVRGALGELMGIAMLPWVLWAITELFEEKKRVKLKTAWLALTVAGFSLSHTVLNLIGWPVIGIYGLVYGLMTKASWKKYRQVGLGGLLGLGLASFFIVPGFLEKSLTQVDKLTTGFSHYSHHFLYLRQFWGGNWGYGGSVDGINDGMSFHLGKVHLLLVAITVGLTIINYLKKKKMDLRLKLTGLSLAMLAGLAWLSSYRAQPVWDRLAIMAYIQFPWRLNSILIILIALVGGGSLFYLTKLAGKKMSWVVLVGASLLIIGVNLKYFKPKGYIQPESLYYTEESLIQKNMSGVIPDYLPKWVESQPKEAAETDFEILAGEAEVTVEESKTQRLELMIKAEENFELQLNRFYFPGWQVYRDGRAIEFSYEDNNGIIRLDLPAGKYEVSLVYQPTWIRTVADFISTASLVVIIGWLIKKS